MYSDVNGDMKEHEKLSRYALPIVRESINVRWGYAFDSKAKGYKKLARDNHLRKRRVRTTIVNEAVIAMFVCRISVGLLTVFSSYWFYNLIIVEKIIWLTSNGMTAFVTSLVNFAVELSNLL